MHPSQGNVTTLLTGDTLYHELTLHTLQLSELISRQWLTDSHACQQTLFVATCSRLEVNPTSYSLTVQDGFSSLYVASQEGHSGVVDILLEAGADVHLATTEVWYTVVLDLVSSFVHQPWWQWCSQELWLDLNTEIGIYNKAVKHFFFML